ncbi:uncharacterized protein HD556DRAFT_1442845 [Suillus plorans]|uniref:Uncharacterized protein n=1 Tax=Suillus plorans TaxID=116603 RepID=A0A9P7AR06_9AGAM|nr:uncharacterized protein HD556DRAFT_1442845 [Suillus plorans]KAG1794650.1 hypothetical protein HD556DRAFT_1442845 [Suillus plorans]
MADRPWNDPGPTRGNSLNFPGVSQIDTTFVQALVDTRTEVQKWANRPVEVSHTAGFGIGTPAVELSNETASVVPHRGSRREKLLDDASSVGVEDIEAHSESLPPTSGTVPIVPIETPFFHFDLISAVRAVEAGVEKLRERAETPPAKYIWLNHLRLDDCTKGSYLFTCALR